MDKTQKQAIQVTKEIIVKFIEIGRISPGNFQDFFAPIYREVLKTITTEPTESSPSEDTPRT